MPVLNIKNEEAHRLATELSRRTGESLTTAVVISLRERLQRETGRAEEEDLVDRVMEIGKQCASLPLLDSRTPDQILGYDEHGLPR